MPIYGTHPLDVATFREAKDPLRADSSAEAASE